MLESFDFESGKVRVSISVIIISLDGVLCFVLFFSEFSLIIYVNTELAAY